MLENTVSLDVALINSKPNGTISLNKRGLKRYKYSVGHDQRASSKFLIFFQKTGFGLSCKRSPLETMC